MMRFNRLVREVDGELIVRALKKVLVLKTDGPWELNADLDGQAAKDLKSFLNVAFSQRMIEGNEMESLMERSIAELLNERLDEETKGCDRYETFIIDRDSQPAYDKAAGLAQVIFNDFFR
ncbi:hypothetical protein HK22_02080 [Gluconobacter sp. DsW_056]|uniref:hypothetical protein n=1 Tax=Gluconobacter sp. DsW_056 TaxID=1511209 RepID=UPI000A37C0CC|nr:hypothetical protein [Gluconobacter sp. DsW_056]OUI81668.1 hypothetical protein HK22_02080 [Gluconobacter sp. DsW_056]